jgi:anti-sigma-K factor RskA
MIDHDVHLLAAAYAIHAVDDADRASFEAHLSTCELCRAEVDEFRAIHSSMAQTQAAGPPPALKGRVLDEINRTRQMSPSVRQLPPSMSRSAARSKWTAAALIAAAALLVVVAVSVLSRNDASDPFATELAMVMEQPDARMVQLDEQPNDAGRFKVAWSENLHRAVVIGEDLGVAPVGKAYELWLITPSASMAMHVLDPASDGNVHASFEMPQAPAKWAITVEPESGTEVATGDIIFIGSVA